MTTEMKYKIFTFLLLGITIILCLGYLNQKQVISKLNEQSRVIGKTDTVYLNKEFKPVKEYHTQLLPSYIYFFKDPNKNDPVLSKDSLPDLTIGSNGSIEGDSLVQMLLGSDKLDLSFFRPSTNEYLTQSFKLDLSKYKYNWVNGKLTQKKLGFKLKVQPYVYSKYRHFHKMVDLGIGISFKTRNLQYKLGLNEFYYPNFKSGLGTDLEFSITYNYE